MAEKLEIIITAKDQFSRTMGSLRGMLPSVKTLAISAGAAVSGLGAGLFAIANSTAKAGDEFQKMSLRLGLSSEMLSGMKHAVELSGASMESLEKGVRTLAKRMSDADEGLTEAQRSFETLGIQVKNADGSLKNLDTMMAEAAEGLASMEDNTKRVALAQELFGRSGTQLLPLFKQGAEGLRKMTEEAKALGITFDKTGADEAAAFRDNMLRLQRVFTGIKTQIGQALIPIFNEYAASLKEVGLKLVEVIKKNKEKIKDFAEDFLNIMMYLAQGAGSGIAIIIDSFNSLQILWKNLEIAFAKFSINIHEGLNTIRQAYIGFLEKLGAWERIEELFSIKPDPRTLEMFERLGVQADISARSFKSMILGTQEVVDNLKKLQEQSEKNLENLRKHPSALQAVTDAFAYFKGLIEKVRAEGGIPPFDTENTETTKKNIKELTDAQKSAITALHDMWAEYFLTEEQRLTIWYNRQRELFKDNQKLLNELEMVYQAKREEIRDKQLEDERTWLEQRAEQMKTFAEQTGELITNVFNKVTEGIGMAVGQAIFESENLADALKDLLKGTAQMVVATLVGIGVKRLVLSMLNLTAGVTEQIARMGQLTQQTYASAFAATAAIPIIGPALAPGVAAASTAMMLAGSTAAKTAGMAVGGAAHGGLERVPREQTYLLERGERVLSPQQNRDLMEFMAGQREGGTIEQTNNFSILPNAGNVEAMLQMSRKDWKDVCEDKIIPALRELKLAGVTS